MKTKPLLFWIGDAVACTGFARVTHNVLRYLSESFDIIVLGLNYLGDPHSYSYPIYPAHLGGSPYGVARYRDLVMRFQPDVVCVMHNAWVVAEFVAEHEQLPAWPAMERPPLIAYVPVDGYHIAAAAALNGLAALIAYTRFGAQQLLEGGYHGPMTIIPHGVDLDMYTPRDKAEARRHLGVPELNDPKYLIVGNLNRNQTRKRLDLTLRGFQRWIQIEQIEDRAFLWLHCADEDIGGSLRPLAQYLGIEANVLWPPDMLTTFHGADESELSWLYSAWDLQVSTTLGEGWGLSTMEAMACGIPNLVPYWSSLGEWPDGAVGYMVCTDQAPISSRYELGGLVTSATVAQELQWWMGNRTAREALIAAGLALVQQPKFRWTAIAARFAEVFRLAMAGWAYEIVPEVSV